MIVAGVDFAFAVSEIDLGTIIGPRTKLHCAHLIIKRKPLDVDGTRTDIKAEGYPAAQTGGVNHYVGWEFGVNIFISAVREKLYFYIIK